VIAKPRRTGGTLLMETLSMWTAFKGRNVKVVILSATQEAARRVTESIAETLNGSALTRGAVVDDFATRIRLSNGSEIISLPASQKQVRGFGRGVKLLIIDEAGFVSDELWRAARYIALDERGNGSRIILCGTPWASGFFRKAYDAGLDGDPDHRSFHWTVQDNPNLDHEYLARERDRVSPAEYAAEVLGQWSDAAGALFPRELLEAHAAELELPDLSGLRGPALGIVGVDWGASFDRSAAVGVYRLPVAGLNPDRERIPCYVALPYVWPAGASLRGVVQAVAKVAGAFCYFAPETNGIGQMPTQELARAVRAKNPRRHTTWNTTATTAGLKTTGYGAILALLERGQLVLPNHPDLLRQLAGLRFEQRERGFTRISADNEVRHDDIADALMLAALVYKPPRAHRVVSHLATLAMSRNAPPDAGLPELDCPVVATGAGLRVWQRPALQSVNGPAVSMYARQVPPKPVGIQAGRFFIKGAKGVTQ
jgi:hypothetical protein